MLVSSSRPGVSSMQLSLSWMPSAEAGVLNRIGAMMLRRRGGGFCSELLGDELELFSRAKMFIIIVDVCYLSDHSARETMLKVQVQFCQIQNEEFDLDCHVIDPKHFVGTYPLSSACANRWVRLQCPASGDDTNLQIVLPYTGHALGQAQLVDMA
jgi:hypothetical protein